MADNYTRALGTVFQILGVKIGRMGMRRALLFLPLAISLGWLCLDAPGPFLREAYYVLVIWSLTAATRTVS